MLAKRQRYIDLAHASKRDTLDIRDPDYARYLDTGCADALHQYSKRASRRIDIKQRRLDRDARYDAVLLAAGRDDIPKTLWITHPVIHNYIETDRDPERVPEAIKEVLQNPQDRLLNMLRTMLRVNNMPLRTDSHLCWAFINGTCVESPDRVVALTKLTSYLWLGGRTAWMRNRDFAERELERLYGMGAAYTWVECVHIFVRQHKFVFK
jgi:hypothetical protein